MKGYRLTINSLLAFMIGFMFCFEHAFAAQVKTFAEGLTSPTGLAINTQTRQLYVNCGENGNLWSISINNDASSGGIELITSGFTPKLDMALDSEMNIYGLAHGDDNVYRISTVGEMTECRVVSYSMSTGISIEPPGLSSNRIFFTTPKNSILGSLYISSYNPNSYAYSDGYSKTDGSMRFMDWRKGLNEIIGTYGDQVVSINPNNGSCNTIASGFIAPHGIAQDDSGNIYIADTGAGTITQITSLGQSAVIVAGLNSPIGLAYDSETNKLFVSENIEGKIYSIDMGSEDICLQMITFAQNPVTQQWAAFPTPCDVPLGWEISYDMPNWYPNSGEDSNIYPPIGMDINNPDAILVLTGEAVYTAPYGNSTCVYGTSDSNTIMIEKGAAVNLQSFTGANTIKVESLASRFAVFRSGSTVIFEDTDGTIIRIPATTIAQTFIFKDRSLNLVITNEQVMLSGQVIQATTDPIE